MYARPYCKTNLGKGIAFVLFKKGGDARTALLLDGRKLKERSVRITRASKNRSAAAKKPAPVDESKPHGASRRLKLEVGPA
jgi:nucleolar protein 12